jgi:hypothetical protein
MNRRARAVFAICFALLAFGSASGATLSGRLTTSAYTWRWQSLDGSDEAHLRFFQSARLSAGQLGDMPLSFHAYAQVSADPLGDVSGRDNFRIYHAYLKWRSPRLSDLRIQAGRQRIFAGVGYGTVDGVKAQVAPHPYLTVSGYAGILVPILSEDGIGTWDEGHLWGGRAQVQVKETSASVSFAQREREAVPYTQAGRYSGLLRTGSADQFQRFGLDVRQGFRGRGEIFGRVDYDVEEEKVHDVEVGATLRPSPTLEFATEYQHRRPSISLNSVLSVFELSNDDEFSCRMSAQVNPRVRLTTHAVRIGYEGETSWRAGVGVSVANTYIGYTRRAGYGGENDALTLSVQHPLTPEVTLRVNGNLAGYRLYEGQGDRNRAMAGSFGLGFRPNPKASLDAEAQLLSNEFYGRDLRLFVRGSFWFFKRSK